VLFIYIETWQVHKTPEKKSTCSNFSDTLFNFGKVARNVAGYGNSDKKKDFLWFQQPQAAGTFS
jgi:hypothetical protein